MSVWLMYLWSVTQNGVTFLRVIAFLLLIVGLLLLAYMGNQSLEAESAAKVGNANKLASIHAEVLSTRRKFPVIMGVVFALFLTAALVPTEKQVYAIAGTWAVSSAASSDTTKEAVTELKKWLSQKIQEQQAAARTKGAK